MYKKNCTSFFLVVFEFFHRSGAVESKLRYLINALQSIEGLIAHPWPKSYDTPEAERRHPNSTLFFFALRYDLKIVRSFFSFIVYLDLFLYDTNFDKLVLNLVASVNGLLCSEDIFFLLFVCLDIREEFVMLI